MKGITYFEVCLMYLKKKNVQDKIQQWFNTDCLAKSLEYILLFLCLGKR